MLAPSTYTPCEVSQMPITLFYPSGAPTAAYETTINAWSKTGPIDAYEMSGTHITMVFEPHVKVLADKLANCLDQNASFNENNDQSI